MRAFLHTLFTHIITVPLQVPFFKYLSNLQRLFVTLEIQLSCLNKFYFFVYPDFSLFITTVKYKGVSNLKSIYGPYHHLIVYRRLKTMVIHLPVDNLLSLPLVHD